MVKGEAWIQKNRMLYLQISYLWVVYLLWKWYVLLTWWLNLNIST